MIKTKLGKMALASGAISLLIITGWLVLFYLIQQDKQAVLEARQSSQQLLADTGSALNLNKDKIAKINNYFLSSQAAVSFLNELDQMAQKAGVSLTVGQAEDKASELKLNLSTKGTFAQTARFLQSLENLPYAAKVDRLELKKGEASWQAVFILRILKAKK